MEPTVAAVPRVRASVRSVLGGWRIEPDRAEDMLLAVTELVSNAIRHAGATTDRLRVAITLAAGWLQLDVADGDSALPPTALEVELSPAEAESGRGLVIVDCLVREAGGRLMAFRAGGGKVVRVRIPASVCCSPSPGARPR
nr:ATP-binding protein [Streptomyces flavidovirens]